MAVVVVGILWSAALPAGAARVETPPGRSPMFGVPTIATIGGQGVEPGITVDSAGTEYVATFGPLRNAYLAESTDGGRTFRWIPAAAPLSGAESMCDAVASSDIDLAAGPAGQVFFATQGGLDLTGQSGAGLARLQDDGRTVVANCDPPQSGGNDRPWIAVDGDPVGAGPGQESGSLYLAEVGTDLTETEACGHVYSMQRSLPTGGPTGGLVLGPAKTVATGLAQHGCTWQMGHGLTLDPVAHTVVLPSVVIDKSDSSVSVVATICHAVPFTQDATGLGCDESVINQSDGSSWAYGGLPVQIAADRAGNLYALWNKAPVRVGAEQGLNDVSYSFVGGAQLYFASSTDHGRTWTPAVHVPTPGSTNAVFPTLAAGDAGRVDVAWLGTDATDPARPPCHMDPNLGDTGVHDEGSPDAVDGRWHVYFSQSFAATDRMPTFTAPVDAVGYAVHRGPIAGYGLGTCGDHTLGEFMKMSVGSNGEALITYSDTDNHASNSAELHTAENVDGWTEDVNRHVPRAMVVRQVAGRGVYVDRKLPNQRPAIEGATDVPGDGFYAAGGIVSPSNPALDVVDSSMTRLDADTYRVTMHVADLHETPTAPVRDTDPVLVWNTQWSVPSSSDPWGGRQFFAYAELPSGATLDQMTFWVGELAAYGGAVTYPGTRRVNGTVSAGAPGTITIDVPASAVAEVDPYDDVLHSVTTTTMTLPAVAEYPAPVEVRGALVGGQLFNLIDVAPAYDYRAAPDG